MFGSGMDCTGSDLLPPLVADIFVIYGHYVSSISMGYLESFGAFFYLWFDFWEFRRFTILENYRGCPNLVSSW